MPRNKLVNTPSKVFLAPVVDVLFPKAPVCPLQRGTEVQCARFVSCRHITHQCFICFLKYLNGGRFFSLSPVVGSSEYNDDVPCQPLLPFLVQEGRGARSDSCSAYPASRIRLIPQRSERKGISRKVLLPRECRESKVR